MQKNEQPLVSIGIPFYNSELYLTDTVQSVVNQSYQNWELILIDDGSNDSSLKIATSFENKDSRIRVISDGTNRGLPSRLNQLSAEAKGQFYARMDADDIMFEKRIETQVNYLLHNPEVHLLATGLVSIDNDNSIIGLRKGGFLNHISTAQTAKGGWCAHPTVMGKSSWFKENFYDISLRAAEDFDMWIRTADKSIFVRLEEPLLFYREASTSTSKKYKRSTKYTLKILWKNRKLIGLITVLKLMLTKIFKFMVYALYSLFGASHKLIDRRSIVMSKEVVNKFNKEMAKAIG